MSEVNNAWKLGAAGRIAESIVFSCKKFCASPWFLVICLANGASASLNWNLGQRNSSLAGCNEPEKCAASPFIYYSCCNGSCCSHFQPIVWITETLAPESKVTTPYSPKFVTRIPHTSLFSLLLLLFLLWADCFINKKNEHAFTSCPRISISMGRIYYLRIEAYRCRLRNVCNASGQYCGCSPNLQQQCRSDYLAYYTCCHGDCCIHLQPIPYVFLCIVVFLFIIAVCYGCCSLACNWCCCCRQKQTGPHLPYS
ncbi:unnamed protein product, partial [Mesorhabditis spiculigera]